MAKSIRSVASTPLFVRATLPLNGADSRHKERQLWKPSLETILESLHRNALQLCQTWVSSLLNLRTTA